MITNINAFTEFRKGSNKYGDLINGIMMWLRLHVIEPTTNSVKSKLDTFINDTNTDINLLYEYIKDQEKLRLATFEITISGDEITFNNINNTKTKKLIW